MRCFACGEAIELASGERIGFRDSCPTCHADLHVCRNCLYYDAAAYNECRESSAERVSDRERANRCDYFAPGDSDNRGEDRERARDALASLFKR